MKVAPLHNSEVTELDGGDHRSLKFSDQEDVRWLYIAMDKAIPVDFRECTGDLNCNI